MSRYARLREKNSHFSGACHETGLF